MSSRVFDNSEEMWGILLLGTCVVYNFSGRVSAGVSHLLHKIKKRIVRKHEEAELLPAIR